MEKWRRHAFPSRCVCFDCFLAKPKLAPAFLFPPPLRRGNPVERGGWFGSLVGLDEGVGREGEEEFDEGKEGMAKKGRGG